MNLQVELFGREHSTRKIFFRISQKDIIPAPGLTEWFQK